LWSLGCRVYERTIKQLAKDAMSGNMPWLTVELDGLYVTLKIGGWPLRVYRGSAERPTTNSLRSGAYDLEQQPELPGLPIYDQDWFWLMAIETDRSGKATAVVVEQANSNGQTRNQWPVPVKTNIAAEQPGSRPTGGDVISILKPAVDV